MKTQPQLETEFAQLNRDYALDKKNYEQLVSRRDSAELTGDLDSAGSMADFRLIDPPRASSTPVAPNRIILFPLGLVLAIAGDFLSHLQPARSAPFSLIAKHCVMKPTCQYSVLSR